MSIRPPNATGIAAGIVLALFFGAGAATAAQLITGADIKDGTVSTKDLKNNNVSSKDIKDGTVSSLDVEWPRKERVAQHYSLPAARDQLVCIERQRGVIPCDQSAR